MFTNNVNWILNKNLKVHSHKETFYYIKTYNRSAFKSMSNGEAAVSASSL